MMIKYEYTFNSDTGLTERAVMETYAPYAGLVDSAISAGQPAGVILKNLRNALTGVLEQPLIAIEEAWWVKQEELVALSKVVSTANDLSATTKLDELGATINLTDAELAANSAALDTLLSEHNVIDIAALELKITDDISTVTAERLALEDGGVGNKPNPWLKAYRGVATTSTRPVVTPVIPKADIKKIISSERDKDIRNSEDTLADLAKMNSLLFSMVSTIYGTLSTTAKNKIPAAERAVIDYAITKFAAMQTRGDRQLAKEGIVLIDKLFDREEAIADLVDTLIK